MAGVDGRDNYALTLAAHVDDKFGGSTGANTSSTSMTTIDSWAPSGVNGTKYLLIAQARAYVDTAARVGEVEFDWEQTSGDGYTVLDNIGIQAVSTGAYYRTCMVISEITGGASTTLRVRARVVTGSGEKIYVSAGLQYFLLLPWATFDSPLLVQDTTTRIMNFTSWGDVTTADNMTYTPDNVTDDHFIIGQACVGGGALAGGRYGEHRFSVDGAVKMTTITIYGSAAAASNQWNYCYAGVQTFADTSAKTLKFEQRKASGGPGGNSQLFRQAIFCARMAAAGGARRVVAARGIVGATDRIVTAAHPGR